MANTKSAIKRIRKITKQTSVNKIRKSRYKNAIKKMNLMLEKKDKSGYVGWSYDNIFIFDNYVCLDNIFLFRDL